MMLLTESSGIRLVVQIVTVRRRAVNHYLAAGWKCAFPPAERTSSPPASRPNTAAAAASGAADEPRRATTTATGPSATGFPVNGSISHDAGAPGAAGALAETATAALATDNSRSGFDFRPRRARGGRPVWYGTSHPARPGG